LSTVGSGAVGGVFTPTLFVGAACGALFGGVVHAAMPESSAGASAYALVGMGAFLAGTTHAPLMAIVALFEMTLDYGIVLPLMLSCVVAYYTARAIDETSIYADVLERKQRDTPSVIAGDTIRPLVRPKPVTVVENASFADIVHVFVEHRHNFIYVVDSDNRFLGAVALHDLKAHMHDPALARLIIASELMDPNFPFLEQDATLGEALQRVMLHDGERLPIVDGHGGRMLVGTISKRDLLLAVGMPK
jgi:CIC family chloride channel protein